MICRVLIPLCGAPHRGWGSDFASPGKRCPIPFPQGFQPRAGTNPGGKAGATPMSLGALCGFVPPHQWLNWEALVRTGSPGEAAHRSGLDTPGDFHLEQDPNPSVSYPKRLLLPIPPPAPEAGCSLVIPHHLFSLADTKKVPSESQCSLSWLAYKTLL